jgi:hypothetical protein
VNVRGVEGAYEYGEWVQMVEDRVRAVGWGAYEDGEGVQMLSREQTVDVIDREGDL